MVLCRAPGGRPASAEGAAGAEPGVRCGAMVKSLFWILGFLALGEALALVVPLPGSVLGMVLLAAALGRGLVPAEEARPAADVLVKNMAFFFVPSGVAVALESDAVRASWWPLLAASVGSTLLVLVAVALVAGRGASSTGQGAP